MAEVVDEQAVTLALVVQRLEQQDGKLTGIQSLMNEINRYLRDSVERRLTELDKIQALSQQAIDELKTVVDSTETRVDELEKLTEKLVDLMDAFKWIGGIVGSAVVLWVVSQLLALIH